MRTPIRVVERHRQDMTVAAMANSHVSPSFCCGYRITLHSGERHPVHPKSFKPLRRSVNYAFSVFASVRPATAALQRPHDERQ
ncbi:MAG: hypothetical protein OXC05_16340 [Halieaceae bacterium]|nr:hypothetical protein [Halieaceae bacterium]